MRTRSISTFALLLSAAAASAEVPVKVPVDRYSMLWSEGRSPFTTPKKAAAVAKADPLADWSLGGVSEVSGGYMVTLNHRKNAGEMQIIRPDGVQKIAAGEILRLAPGAPGTFQLDRVEYGSGGWRDISVHLSAGSEAAVIRFDEDPPAPEHAPVSKQTAAAAAKPAAIPLPTKPNPPVTLGAPRAVRVPETELSK